MYRASKKTRLINAFTRIAVLRPRDMYAKYGQRFNTRGLRGTDGSTTSDIIPQSQSVIDSMIAGQDALKRHLNDSTEAE